MEGVSRKFGPAGVLAEGVRRGGGNSGAAGRGPALVNLLSIRSYVAMPDRPFGRHYQSTWARMMKKFGWIPFRSCRL